VAVRQVRKHPPCTHFLIICATRSPNERPIIPLDCTPRARPDGLTLAETVAALRRLLNGDVCAATTVSLIRANVGSLEDAYLPSRQKSTPQHNAVLLHTRASEDHRTRPQNPRKHRRTVLLPLFAEDRVHTAAHARQCIETGAYAVVVATAITDPTTLTGLVRPIGRHRNPNYQTHNRPQPRVRH
jgi:N-acylglucosamine-6-phosphate 2-epimerase